MKRILFYIAIVLSVLLPNSFCAKSAAPEFGSNLTQQNDAFDESHCNGVNLNFEACLEEFSDDDESNESESKKLSSGNILASNTSFVAQNYSDNYFNTTLPAHFFFPSKTPIFIFLCVFRL